jgi:hypothetical protein
MRNGIANWKQHAGPRRGDHEVLYYLDTVIVIYAVEGSPANQLRALNHLGALEAAGHQFAISDLTRTECLVPVFGPGGGQRLSDFFRFFHGPNLRTLSLTAAMHTRASAIRGGHTYPAVPPLSRSGTDWPTPFISPPRSNPAATCF